MMSASVCRERVELSRWLGPNGGGGGWEWLGAEGAHASV